MRDEESKKEFQQRRICWNHYKVSLIVDCMRLRFNFSQCIGIVPQDTVLFNDTILHNIKYGRSEATMEEVIPPVCMMNCYHINAK